MDQPLRGLVGQPMSGARPPNSAIARVYPAGSWTFTTPAGGLYEVAAWSPGSGGGGAGGISASGALSVARRYLGGGATITITVGQAIEIGNLGGGGSGSSTNTSVTFPDGTTLSVAAASLGTPGTASGGDVNVNGTASGSNSVGAAGPSYDIYNGGPASSVAGVANAPAGGATPRSNGALGGDGLVIISRIR